MEIEMETAALQTAQTSRGSVESTGWAVAWPQLKALAAGGDKDAAMSLFAQLRAGRAPAPRADLLKIPEAEAVAWLTANYPLG